MIAILFRRPTLSELPLYILTALALLALSTVVLWNIVIPATPENEVIPEERRELQIRPVTIQVPDVPEPPKEEVSVPEEEPQSPLEICDELMDARCVCSEDQAHSFFLCRRNVRYDMHEGHDPLYLVTPDTTFKFATAKGTHSAGSGGEWSVKVSHFEVIEKRGTLVHIDVKIEDFRYNRINLRDMKRAYGDAGPEGNECLDQELCDLLEMLESQSRECHMSFSFVLDLEDSSQRLMAVVARSKSCGKPYSEQTDSHFARNIRLSDDGQALEVDDHRLRFVDGPHYFPFRTSGISRYVTPLW